VPKCLQEHVADHDIAMIQRRSAHRLEFSPLFSEPDHHLPFSSSLDDHQSFREPLAPYSSTGVPPGPTSALNKPHFKSHAVLHSTATGDPPTI
jgi:hypothetical protein